MFNAPNHQTTSNEICRQWTLFHSCISQSNLKSKAKSKLCLRILENTAVLQMHCCALEEQQYLKS